MAGPTLTQRVEILEQTVAELALLPARMSAVELQIVQLRDELHAGFSAVRQEMAVMRDDLRYRAEEHGRIVARRDSRRDSLGDEETRRYMRVLHEDVTPASPRSATPAASDPLRLCALRPLLPLRPRRYFLGNSNTYIPMPVVRVLDLRRDCARHLAWAAAAEPGRDRDVLPPVDGERHRDPCTDVPRRVCHSDCRSSRRAPGSSDRVTDERTPPLIDSPRVRDDARCSYLQTSFIDSRRRRRACQVPFVARHLDKGRRRRYHRRPRGVRPCGR